MNITSKIVLAGFVTLALSVPVQAQGLLGGLLGGSGDSGGTTGGVVDGLLGDGGTVDTLLSGGGVEVPLNLGNSEIGIEGVATISTATNDQGGSNIGVEVLGGGGGTLSTNPLGILGSGGDLGVELPDLGGLTGIKGNGGNGGNGGAGGAGGNGGSGRNGGNGGNGGGINGTGGPNITYFATTNNRNGGGVLPSGISSRLQKLIRMLEARDYLRVSNGRSVCLNGFGVAEVSGWVPQRDWGALQTALSNYSQDIYALRQLLANCRSGEQRQALNLTNLNRVITLDIDNNGRPVLYML